MGKIHWGSVALGLILGFVVRHYMAGRTKATA